MFAEVNLCCDTLKRPRQQVSYLHATTGLLYPNMLVIILLAEPAVALWKNLMASCNIRKKAHEQIKKGLGIPGFTYSKIEIINIQVESNPVHSSKDMTV